MKVARVEKGLTQSESAAKLGVSTVTLSKWEKNRGTMTLDNAINVAKVYEKSLDSLFFET